MYWNLKDINNVTITTLKNLSQINFADILSILPEIYLISMTLIALILIGMANFSPEANNIQKKKKLCQQFINLV